VDVSQLVAAAFLQKAGQAYLGRVGLRMHATVAGAGWLLGRDPFRAYFLYGGQFMVVE
jgi:hypothetical protein